MLILAMLVALTVSQEAKPFLQRLEMSSLIPQISQNLVDYLKDVEVRTNRQVVVYVVDEQESSSGSSAFFNRTADGEVRITLAGPVDFASSRIEASLAHEATHGLFMYGEGYCDTGFRMPRASNRAQFEALQGQFAAFEVLTSILEDIPIDRRIQEAGFSPIDEDYRGMLREGLDAAKTGRDPYPSNVRPEHRMAHSIFNGYILAWAFREYLDVSPPDRALLGEYLAAFEQAYPADFMRAQEVRRLIETNDIFTPQGHGQILRGAIEILQLENVQVACPAG